jgi:hypothetical protein
MTTRLPCKHARPVKNLRTVGDLFVNGHYGASAAGVAWIASVGTRGQCPCQPIAGARRSALRQRRTPQIAP